MPPTELGITGYQAEEWLLQEEQLTVQLGDSRRVVCSMAHADDDAAIERLAEACEKPDQPAPHVPPSEHPNPDQAMNPREAFLARTEQVADPAARISAEIIKPVPAGCAGVSARRTVHGEIVEYLRAGFAAGMVVPDAADSELRTFRVVRPGAPAQPPE
jgi:arginine decarboxylase